MQRRTFIQTLGAAAAVATVGGLSTKASAAEHTLKIGTLAPKASPWGQVFTVWQKAVAEKSGGRMELQFFYNGQQGDEDSMVAKMKTGQLNGAAVTAVGLSKIYKPILALQLPGLFSSWSKLDEKRDGLKRDFEKGALDAGFTIAGWGDVGRAYLMSKGFPVRVPTDLQGKKPYMWRADVILPALYQVIGGVSGVPLNVPEVLPNLNTGAINVITAPALAAEQLQWSSKLDHIVTSSSSFAIGALVMSTKAMEALPEDLRTILTDTGKIAANALTTRIRNEDDAALKRMKGKMTVVELSSDEKAKWEGVFKQVRQRLAQGTFSPDLIAKLEG